MHVAVGKPGKGVPAEVLMKVLNAADNQQLKLRQEEGWRAVHLAVGKPGKGVPAEVLMKVLDAADNQQLKLRREEGWR